MISRQSLRVAQGTCLVLIAGFGVLAGCEASPVVDGEWTRFGGVRQDFIAEAEGLASEWPEGGPPQLWSRELGDGYSSILVDESRLYTMYRTGGREAVICMQARNGRTIWEHRYDETPYDGHISRFGEGPRATPLISGDRIYAIGVAGMMHCLDKYTGNVEPRL